MDTKKNNNKLIMYIMITVLFDFVVTGLYPVTAKADEIGTYTEVQIAANIPNGFQEDIVVTLKSDFSENKYQVVLNTGNNYRSSLTVISNTTYSSSAAIKTSKYKIHIYYFFSQNLDQNHLLINMLFLYFDHYFLSNN